MGKVYSAPATGLYAVTVIGTFCVTVPTSFETVTQTRVRAPGGVSAIQEPPVPEDAVRTGLEPPSLEERERVAAVSQLDGYEAGLTEHEGDGERVACAVTVRRDRRRVGAEPGQSARMTTSSSTSRAVLPLLPRAVTTTR